MLTRAKILGGFAIAILGLGACGSGGEGNPATEFAPPKIDAGNQCRERLAGGNTRIEVLGHDTCFVCGNSDLANIIDVDPESFGQISISGPALSPTEGITVRVTAQDGVVFPGGTQAMAVAHYPSIDLVGSLYMRALLNGVTVSEGRVDAHVVGGYVGTGTPEKQVYLIPVSGPFNQIELTLSNTGLGDASVTGEPIYPGVGRSMINIFELCRS